MKTIVCMKQVPSSNEVCLHPVTKTIVRDGKSSVINPFDATALEVAVGLKERHGGTITALSMGILNTKTLLLDAMSRGADGAVLLSDRGFAGADTLATSYTLGLGVEKIGEFDLILCGKMAVDGDTAQIGPELATVLGIPYVTDVIEVLKSTPKGVVVRRHMDGGHQTVAVDFPVLLTVVRELAQPRLPSIASIRGTLDKEVTVYTAQDLEADPQRIGINGSPTQVVDTFVPQANQDCVTLTGDLSVLVEKVVKLSKEVDGHG